MTRTISKGTAVALTALSLAGLSGMAAPDTARAAIQSPTAAKTVASIVDSYTVDDTIIDGGAYTIPMPEQWVGRVNVTKNGDTAIITSRAYPQTVISTLIASNMTVEETGDLSYSMIGTRELSDGRHVELWATRYAYAAVEGEGVGDAAGSEATDLQTGGRVDYAQLVRDLIDGNGAAASGLFAVDDYLTENLLDLIS